MSEDNQNISNSFNNQNNDDKNKDSIMLEEVGMGSLPEEISEFLNNESYSLLVKGKPGAGKTTFALTLMDNLNNESNYFYISTRLSIKQLSLYFPWIKKFLSTEDKNYGYRFEDARLDEPESLFERITNQLMDVKSPVIIIDTWDTIASFMDRESRLNNERVLQIWRERAGAKLIFLSETIDLGILDSIVDGVVSLNIKNFRSNIYRELTLNKLRGVPIKCCRYSYSLFNGIFHAFETTKNLSQFYNIENDNEMREKFESINQQQGNSTILTKYYQNNLEMFFCNKNLISLIIDPKINNELLVSILLMYFCYWLRQNNSITINNFDDSFFKSCVRILNRYIDEKILEQNFMTQTIDFKKFSTDEMTDSNKIFLDNANLSFPKSFSLDHKRSKAHYLPKFRGIMKEGTKILNVLNGKDILSVLLLNSFLTLLEKGYAMNLILLRDSIENVNPVFYERTKCYHIFIRNKNILMQSVNNDIPLYGLIKDKDSLYANWIPLL